MKGSAHLEVLGGCRLAAADRPVRLTARKAQILLALLAVARSRTMPRSRLAALLWENADADGARASLRQSLAQLRRATGDGWLETQGDTIRLADAVSTDVEAFEAALARGDDAEAARLYAGPFLEGIGGGTPDLDAAIEAERTRLSDLAAGALRRELDRLEDRPETARTAHRLLALDPLDEAAHRKLMIWDAARGARGAARSRFENLQRALKRDLGVDPQPETMSLFDRIRRGAAGRTVASETQAEASTGEAGETARTTAPALLLLAMAGDDEPDWNALDDAIRAAGGRPVESGAGEAAALWSGADLRTVCAAALDLAEAFGSSLSFGLRPAEETGASDAVPPRSFGRARRLAARADPGTVLMTAELAGRVGLATMADEPVRLRRDAPSSRPMLPIVGREVELVQIASALSAAFGAGAGLVVHLSGEAGIGKSRLAAEIASRSTARRVASVGFDPFMSGSAHIARNLAAALISDAPQDAGEPFERAVLAWLRDGPIEARDELRLSALAEGELRERVLDVLARRIVAATESVEKGGLLIIVEDCHWAPPGMGDFLLDLSERMAKAPVALILTERPHEASLDHRLAARGRTSLVRLTLAPLAPEPARRLAELAAPDRTDRAEALDHAAGHPLFLLRLLEAEWSAGSLPASVTDLVLEQLERLPTDQREALRRASILGVRFDPENVAAIFPEAAHLLPQGDLVHAVGTDLAFGHDLVRQAIYGDLSDDLRRNWHGRASLHFRGVDPLRWAEHASLAEDDGEAARAHMAAANAMFAAMRMDATLRHIDSGLARGGDAEAVAELHSCRAGIRRTRGDLRGALDDYRAAHARAVEDETCIAMLVRQALVLHRLDRGDEADRALDAAEALADAIGLSGRGRAEIHEQRGNRAFVEGDVERCLREHEAGLAAARVAGDDRGLARAHGGIGDALFSMGRMRAAHEQFDRAMEIATRAGLGLVHQEFGFMRSYTLFFADPGERAHVLADLAVEAAQGAGVDRAEMIARETRAEMRLAALDLEGAREDIDRLDTFLKREFEPRFAADLASLQAWLSLREGHRDRTFAALRHRFEEAGEDYYNGTICFALGAAAAPDEETSRTWLAAGERRLAAGALSCAAIWFHCFALECATRYDDPELGRRHAKALRESAGATGEEPPGLARLATQAATLHFGTSKAGHGDVLRDLTKARLRGFTAILGEPTEEI